MSHPQLDKNTELLIRKIRVLNATVSDMISKNADLQVTCSMEKERADALQQELDRLRAAEEQPSEEVASE